MKTIGKMLRSAGRHARGSVVVLLAAVLIALLPGAYYAGEVYRNHQDQGLFAPYHPSAALVGADGTATAAGSA